MCCVRTYKLISISLPEMSLFGYLVHPGRTRLTVFTPKGQAMVIFSCLPPCCLPVPTGHEGVVFLFLPRWAPILSLVGTGYFSAFPGSHRLFLSSFSSACEFPVGTGALVSQQLHQTVSALALNSCCLQH